MKGFIASIVTLCLLVGAVIWNGIWIQQTTGELLQIAANIPDDITDENTLAKCKELSGKWDSSYKILGISVSHTEIQTIKAGITALTVFAENGEISDFAAALAALREELQYLRHSESLNLEGII